MFKKVFGHHSKDDEVPAPTSTVNTAQNTGTNSASTGARSAVPATHTSQATPKTLDSTTGTAGSGTHITNPVNQEGLAQRKGEMSSIVQSTPNLPTSGVQSFEARADYDKEHWHEAMEKTELAEHEVAEATLHASKADQALAKAQAAERKMQAEANETDRLLTEAERQRGLVTAPGGARREVGLAQGNLAKLQDEAARERRAIKEAEEAAALKERELQGLQPALKEENQLLERLARDYDSAMQQSEEKHVYADRLQAQLRDLDAQRKALRDNLMRLEERLRRAEEEVAQAEREHAEAKQRRAYLEEELQRAKPELARLTGIWETATGDYDITLRSVHGWDHKIAQLRTAIGEEESAYKQLQAMVDALRAEVEALLERLRREKAAAAPDAEAVAAAERDIAERQRRLQEAEVMAKEAQNRYRMLVEKADREKAEAAEAAKVAKVAAAEYEKELREAELHESRHEELWREAQKAGEMSSHQATDRFAALKAKAANFTHAEP